MAEYIDISVDGVASASSSYSGNPPEYAFDKNTGTGWGNNNQSPTFLQYKFNSASPDVIKKYSITWGDVSGWGTNTSYAPKSWEFQGSNDGTIWTTLDTQENMSWSVDETKEFFLPQNNVSYQYVRLYFIAYGTYYWVDLQELKLFAVVDEPDENNNPGRPAYFLGNIPVKGNKYFSGWLEEKKMFFTGDFNRGY